jgi:hypothetical protein
MPARQQQRAVRHTKAGKFTFTTGLTDGLWHQVTRQFSLTIQKK